LIYCLASTPSLAPDKAERGAVWESLRSATYSKGQCGALLDFKGWKKRDLRSKPPIPIFVLPDICILSSLVGCVTRIL